MRTLRFLAGGAVVALSTAIVVFVSADRLAHSGRAPVARIAVSEPSATGSIPSLVAAALPAKPVAPAIPNGFDTERLNALMRGDPILPGRR